jgi:hypothetical protein
MLLVEIAVDAASVAAFVAKHVVYAVSKRFFFHCSVECLNQEVFIQIICGVGHHIYAD